MDKFPLLRRGRAEGELTARREPLCTWFDVRWTAPQAGLWCAWAVGEQGELRLGVLEPSGDAAALRRQFSQRMTEPLGRLLRGEVRPIAEGEAAQWSLCPAPETLFRTPWLRQQLRGVSGALVRPRGGGRQVALPWKSGEPFPLQALFCLARTAKIGEKNYVVYTFRQDEMPLITPSEEKKKRKDKNMDTISGGGMV